MCTIYHTVSFVCVWGGGGDVTLPARTIDRYHKKENVSFMYWSENQCHTCQWLMQYIWDIYSMYLSVRYP